MKKKSKLLTILASLLCCFMLVGCTGGGSSKFVSTPKSIYTFYQSYLTAQDSLDDDIAKINFSNTEKLNINYATNSVYNTKQEELAIIASIECYNTNISPKEIYINIENGNGIISVKSSSRVYVCEIILNNVTTKYEFTISKETSSGKYIVKYYQEVNGSQKECKSDVIFDKTTSHLSIDISSYNSLGEQIKTNKDFYILNNNHTAIKIDSIEGTGNNRSMYSFSAYKEIVSYSLKISSINTEGAKLVESDLSRQDIVRTQTSENCGYIVDFNSNANVPTYETFGDMTKW